VIRKFEDWVKEHLGVRLEIVKHPWTGIRGTWAPQGVKVDWEKIIPKGFHVLPRRWVVERTFSWITRHRRLSRDFETSCAVGAPLRMTIANSGQKILLANP
jgi:transposase